MPDMMRVMTDAVADLIDKGASFKSAFAEVAHQHDIWHHRMPERYNFFFRQVMRRVKKKVGRPKLVRSCKNQKRGPITKQIGLL